MVAGVQDGIGFTGVAMSVAGRHKQSRLVAWCCRLSSREASRLHEPWVLRLRAAGRSKFVGEWVKDAWNERLN